MSVGSAISADTGDPCGLREQSLPLNELRQIIVVDIVGLYVTRMSPSSNIDLGGCYGVLFASH